MNTLTAYIYLCLYLFVKDHMVEERRIDNADALFFALTPSEQEMANYILGQIIPRKQ